jgi:hypothetical protein
MPAEMVSPVVTALAAVIEECAHMRAHRLPSPDDPDRTDRALHAEATGRELLLAWLRPTSFPSQTTLGAELKRLVGLLQTLLHASTPEEQVAPILTAACRHVDLSDVAASALRDLAMLLVLSAWNDGAMDVAITLEPDGDAYARLCVESDQAGMASAPPAHPRVAAIRRALTPLGGSWNGMQTNHGSWLIDVRVPALVAHTEEYR